MNFDFYVSKKLEGISPIIREISADGPLTYRCLTYATFKALSNPRVGILLPNQQLNNYATTKK